MPTLVQYDLTLETSPEGAIAAAPGSVCVDTVEGKSYIKRTAASAKTGWKRFLTTDDRPWLNLVADFGATGDGTDHTGVFQVAVAAASSGAILYVPDGTYEIDNLEVTKDISFRLSSGAVLRHKANAAGPMIEYTADASGSFEGGTLDGNKTNQNGDVWYGLLKVKTSDQFSVDRVIFQDFTFAGVHAEELSGKSKLTVQNCRFIDGAEHGGVLNDKLSCGIFIIVYVQDARPHIVVDNCTFIQNSAPSQHGAAPGGIFVQGADEVNSHPSVTITRNYLENLGQDILGNHIGPIDLYEDVLNAIVCFNTVINARYNALKLQNCGRLVCTGNVCEGNDSSDTYSGILYDPQQRTQSDGLYDDAIIAHNIIKDEVSTLGIMVQGANASAKRISIDTNHVNCVRALRIEGDGGVEAPLLVKGNTFRSTSDTHPTVGIENFSGVLRFSDNDVRSTRYTAFQAVVSLTGAYIHLTENYFETAVASSYAANVRGVAGVYFHSGRYRNTAAGPAVDLRADDDLNSIGEAIFGPDNVVQQGTVGFQDVTLWKGIISATGSPEAVFAANRGTLFRSTNGGAGTTFYVKESGDGLNTGWVAK